VHLVNGIGSTEIATVPIYTKDPEDWEYFHYNPDLKGVEFRDLGEGLYEQVIVRHPSTDHFHATWWTFPELQEYSPKDLYVKHPTKPNLWKCVGRADDVIVLSNGEKLNPTAMEATIRQHPDVKNALVVGQAKFAPAVIVELNTETAVKTHSREEFSRLLDDIWPFVVSANKSAPAHAQVSQDMILFSDPEKKFLVTPKGTVQRQATVRLYAGKIEELYQRNDEQLMADLPKIDVGAGIETLEGDLARLLQNTIGVPHLDAEQDFFAAGMDSLHVMRINKQLKSALDAVPKDEINARLIYGNPTIRMLAIALKNLCATNGTSNGTNGRTNGQISRERVMEDTLNRFLEQLPEKSADVKGSAHSRGEAMTIILTGSTGSLGSYLLDTLISSPKVSKVYCLNRRPDAGQHQAKVNAARGLVSKWDRVEFLHVDLSKPSLGLEESIYERLRDETSAIIRKLYFTSQKIETHSQIHYSRQSMAGRFQSCVEVFRKTHCRCPQFDQSFRRFGKITTHILRFQHRNHWPVLDQTQWRASPRNRVG